MATKTHQTTTPMMRYQLKAESKDRAELMIYDTIGESFVTGEGLTARSFAKDLKNAGDVKNIDVRINSVGGSVFDGQAIYSQLRNHPANVTVHVDGAALSAASVIAMAGDEIKMAENAVMMIHEPWSIAMGSASTMRKEADVLDKLRDTISSVYAARTGKDKEEIDSLLSAETWMDATEAVDMGFADSITPTKKAAASAAMPDGLNVPERFRSFFNHKPQPENSDMATETLMTPADYAAANPDAVKDWVNQGFKEGHDEATKEMQARASALAKAFASDPKFALDQFIVGHDVPHAKAEYADVLEAKLEASNKKVAELQAKPQTAGTQPITTAAPAEPQSKPDPSDHKATAEWEWDNDATLATRFSNKQSYVNVRKAELSGQLRVRN